MYCKRCGEKLDNSSKFCSNCGEPVIQDKKISINAKEARLSKILLFLLLAIVVVVSIIVIVKKSEKKTWKEYYDLGERYLSEENYEEAVVAFTAAIEIDAKKALAYLGRGEAYVKSGQPGNYELALEDYRTALSLDDTLSKGYLGIADVYIRQREFESAIEILQEGKEKAENEQEIVDKLEDMENGYMIDSSGNMILPLQAEDLSWIVEPVYEYKDVEPIYGEAFSDIGAGGYSNGTTSFFDDEFCELSFPSYSNLPEYYNLKLENGNWKVFYMPQMIENTDILEAGTYRFDITGLSSYPIDEQSNTYFHQDIPWDVLSTLERGTYSGYLCFDNYSKQVYLFVNNVEIRELKHIIHLGLHKPYPVGKRIDTSLGGWEGSPVRDFSDKIWNGDIEESLYAYVNPNGELITDFLYEEATDFSDGIAACCKGGKWGYIDESGEQVTEFIYDAPWNLTGIYGYYPSVSEIAYPCTSDTIVVSKQGDMGVLYRDGRILIDYGQFEDLAPAWNDQLWAKQEGKWGLIDLSDAKKKAGIPVEAIDTKILEYIIGTDPDGRKEEQGEGWKQAYIDYLQKMKEENEYFYEVLCCLLYVNNDNMPELYIEYPSLAEGAEICTFYEGKINKKSVWPGCCYIENENLVHDSGGRMGIYYDSIYQIIRGEFVELAHGEYGAYNNAELQFDENDEVICDYYRWDSIEVTAEEYQQFLNSACDSSKEKEIVLWPDGATIDDMIQQITDM